VGGEASHQTGVSDVLSPRARLYTAQAIAPCTVVLALSLPTSTTLIHEGNSEMRCSLLYMLTRHQRHACECIIRTHHLPCG
jgi:hypothetical protein